MNTQIVKFEELMLLPFIDYLLCSQFKKLGKA